MKKVVKKSLPLSAIKPRYTRENNPNKMEPERYAALVEFMRNNGFLQPILALPQKDGTHEIADGHHRFWSATDIGLPSVDAVILDEEQARSELIGLGMNRLRGDMDLTIAADIIRRTKEDADWSDEQLAMFSGFTADEITALLKDTEPQTDDNIIEEAAGAGAADDTGGKTFVLEIVLSTKENLRLVKRRLMKASGKAKSLEIGLLAVLGEL